MGSSVVVGSAVVEVTTTGSGDEFVGGGFAPDDDELHAGTTMATTSRVTVPHRLNDPTSPSWTRTTKPGVEHRAA
jgi:hypothetical protein